MVFSLPRTKRVSSLWNIFAFGRIRNKGSFPRNPVDPSPGTHRASVFTVYFPGAAMVSSGLESCSSGGTYVCDGSYTGTSSEQFWILQESSCPCAKTRSQQNRTENQHESYKWVITNLCTLKIVWTFLTALLLLYHPCYAGVIYTFLQHSTGITIKLLSLIEKIKTLHQALSQSATTKNPRKLIIAAYTIHTVDLHASQQNCGSPRYPTS